MKVVRTLLGLAGGVMLLVGLLFLSDDGVDDLVHVVAWFAGGVIAHDAVIAGLTIAVGALVVPRLPEASRAPAVVGLVVLLSVTLMAIPVLGRFGAKADDHGLLDRSYGLLWLCFAVLVLGAVVGASLVRSRRPGPR